jgi:hypothetical protein
MINKKVLIGAMAIMLAATSFGLDIDGKVKSSFGFFIGGDNMDQSWATEKAANNNAGYGPAGDKELFKSTVGLTLKNDDTSLYWESKFQTNGTSIAMAAAYLYINTELKSLPGSLRVGYQRWGILDAETHPYADGSFYTFNKDKGIGLSYFVPIGDYDLKITQLGGVPGLEGYTNNNNACSFLGAMLKSGKDWSIGAVYSKTASSNSSGDLTGFSLYGDYTMIMDDLKLVGTAWYDLSDDASKAYITSKTKAKQYLGLYATYDLNADTAVYVNYLLDNNQVNISNKLSGGVKYKLSSRVTGMIHCESITAINGSTTGATSVALETSL